MARQPLSRAVLALLPVIVLGCRSSAEWEGTFDVPEAVDVVADIDGNPFGEPVGYAASLHGGRVAVLGLRQGRYLPDSPNASFVRAAPLAAGSSRILGSIAAVAPGDGTVTVYAADRAYRTLVRLPHVIGVDADGTPERLPSTVSTPEFIDADGSGDSPALSELTAVHGFATAEDWTLTFDGVYWTAAGSRSGSFDLQVLPGEDYQTEDAGITFTVDGVATAGDQFVFSTDNGATEIAVGGTPLHLSTAPDQQRIAIILARDSDPAVLAWLDPMTGQLDKDVPLPEEATPVRMAWSPDGRLFVADASRSSFWEVTPGDGSDADTVVEHVLPWPVSDVAPLLSETSNTVTVAPLPGTSVWVYDLDAGALRDLNALKPGVNGIELHSLIRGIGSVHQPFLWPQLDDEKVPLRGRAVAISLHRGALVFLGEDTNCLITDELGPRVAISQSATPGRDYSTDPGDVVGVPYLEPNGSNANSVIVNRCGGVALSEAWKLRYDANQAGWVVRGSVSGEQDALAHEDRRYVSDSGAVSFTIRSGQRPSEDGWTLSFTVTDGLLGVSGDNGNDGTRDVAFSLPGDPVSYREVKTITDEPWRPVIDQPYVLVPASGSDLIAKIDPLTGSIDVAWW